MATLSVDLLAALGLALAIEGLLMAAAPGLVREGARALVTLRSDVLRGSGIAAAVVGLAVVWLVRG